MPFFIPAAMALGSGIANMLSGDQAAQQRNQQIDTAEGVLGQNMLTDKDLNDLLLQNKRYYNAGLTNLLNSTAISTRGTANAPVVAGAVASNLIGKEAQSATQIQESVLANNRDTRNRMAMLDTQRATNSPIADFFGGAVSGLTAGMEFNKYLDMSSNTQSPSGTGTLAAGTATISTTAVTANSLILLTPTSNSSLGTLYVGTVTAGTSFVINSTNVADTSTFNWVIVEKY